MTMKKLLVCIALAFGAAGAGIAHADSAIVALADGSAGTAPLDAAPDTGSATVTPADRLHDPISSPAATIDDIKQAKRQGWGVLAFALGVIVAKLLGRAKSISWLAALSKGRTAVIVGAASALVVATYNALADGGSLYAGLYAGAVAVAAWWQSHPGDAT